MFDIRPATADDVPALAVLLPEYMRELFGGEAIWRGTPEALARDGFGSHFEMVVVARAGECHGFVGWRSSYDLHHCISGAEVLDLYVRPELRGRGVALQMVAAIAAMVRARGGTFIKGQAVGPASTRRLYERLAVAFEGADCIVGGRAFRTLADLAGKSARVMVRGLPDKASNYEP
jgi:GNAT superfamily N-acetyltransferase